MSRDIAQKIAEMWFFSCNAPDTNRTASEIERLATLILDVSEDKIVEWKVVRNYLHIKDLED